MSHINPRQVAKNSLFLYLRVFVIMLISLWTTRIVLRNLGVVDYGIYNVVAGFVVMFAILSSSMSAAISRYITFELGKENLDRLKTIFRTSIYIQAILAGSIFILAETAGLWFVNVKLNVERDNLIAANWVYQFAIFNFIMEIISIPFNATIIAHERMKVFAYIGILKAAATLLIAFLLVVVPSHQRLIFYAALLFLLSFILRLIYGFYCHKHFPETKGRAKFDKSILKEIFRFAGWNFIGSSAGIAKDQGVNIVLNIFFGPVVNASRGIAIQVSAAATTFANNFMVALNPQITKSYSSGDLTGSFKLCYLGARMGYFLMFLIGVPIIIETPQILRVWLGEIPQYSVIFVRLIIINALIDILSYTLMVLQLANGNIRNYQIVVGMCNLLVLPIAYILMKFHYPPQAAIIGGIVMSIVALLCRVIMVNRSTGLPIAQYFNDVILRVLIVSTVSLGCIYLILKYSPFYNGILQIAYVTFICLIISTSAIYLLGISKSERKKLLSVAKKYIYKK